MKQKIIVVLGQTASGKSALSVNLAKHFRGEIISADSRQVYKGLNIGAGKVAGKWLKVKSSPSQILFGKIWEGKGIKRKVFVYKNIKHYCIDFVNPKRTYTVSQYKKCAERAISDIACRKMVPIICGGTGLYIDAVLNNIDFPEVKPNPKLRAKLEKLSSGDLLAKLQNLDPQRAKTLTKNSGYKNKRRLIRALEIIYATKKTITYFGEKGLYENNGGSPYDVLYLGIIMPEIILKKRIHVRLTHRIRQGLIQEVKSLRVNEKLSWKRLISLGLEYKYTSLYLQNFITKEEFIAQLEKEIWRYAKRQKTWFKKNDRIRWVCDKNEAIKIAKRFLSNNPAPRQRRGPRFYEARQRGRRQRRQILSHPSAIKW